MEPANLHTKPKDSTKTTPVTSSYNLQKRNQDQETKTPPVTSSYNLRKRNQDQETETPPSTSPYNLRKRSWNQEDEAKTKDNIAKRIRAMLALIEQGEYDSDYCETAFAVSTKDKKIIEIPLP